MIARLFCLISLALLSAGTTFAKEPTFAEMPAVFKAGMEVEITADHLAKIMPFYDFENFQAKKGKEFSAPAGFYDDYLRDNPRALDSLPADLKAKLKAGLQLESLVQREIPKLELPAQKPEAATPAPRLMLPEAPPPTRPSLILPGLKPEETAANFRVAEGGLIKPARLDWETLYQRWRELPEAEKAAVARWELLSPLHKAHLAHGLENDLFAQAGPLLTLKPEAPALLKKLHWHVEMDAMEYKHAVPVTDPQSLYRDIVEFGRLTGVSSKLENAPESRLKGVSLHYHLSVPGRDLKQLAHRLNDLTLLKRVDQGIINDLAGMGDFIYTNQIEGRGLVRLAAPDRIEMRVHPEKLALELPFITEILSLPEKEGLERIDAQIKALLQKRNVTDLIKKYRPSLFSRWEGAVPAELLAEARNPEATLIRQLRSDDPAVVKAAIRHMEPISLLSPRAQAAAAALLTPEALSRPQGVELGYFLAGRIAIGAWPEAIFEQILNLVPKIDESNRGNLLFNIINRPWPASVEPKLFEFLQGPGITENTKKLIVRELVEAEFEPAFLGRALNANLPGHFRAPLIEKALDAYATVPWNAGQEEAAHLILRGLPGNRVSEFLPWLRAQERFRPEVLPELAALTQRKDLSAKAKEELRAMLGKLSAKSAKEVRNAGIAEEFGSSLKNPGGLVVACKNLFARLRGN